MYNNLINLSLIILIIALSFFLISVVPFCSDDKENNKFGKILFLISIILFFFGFFLLDYLLVETDKTTLITTHKIYNIKKEISYKRNELEEYYILNTSNGYYKLNDVNYIKNGKMKLEIYQKYCRICKIDGRYRFIINE